MKIYKITEASAYLGVPINTLKTLANKVLDRMKQKPQQKQKPLRIYISGPMSGVEDYNYPQFFKWHVLLEDAGHEVENPVMNDIRKIKEGWTYDPEMHDKLVEEDCEIVRSSKVDAVFMMRGHKKSSGAGRERQAAVDSGKEVFFEDSMEDIIALLGYSPALQTK